MRYPGEKYNFSWQQEAAYVYPAGGVNLHPEARMGHRIELYIIYNTL